MAATGELRRDRETVTAQLRRLDRPRRFVTIARLLLLAPLIDVVAHAAAVAVAIAQGTALTVAAPAALVSLATLMVVRHVYGWPDRTARWFLLTEFAGFSSVFVIGVRVWAVWVMFPDGLQPLGLRRQPAVAAAMLYLVTRAVSLYSIAADPAVPANWSWLAPRFQRARDALRLAAKGVSARNIAVLVAWAPVMGAALGATLWVATRFSAVVFVVLMVLAGGNAIVLARSGWERICDWLKRRHWRGHASVNGPTLIDGLLGQSTVRGMTHLVRGVRTSRSWSEPPRSAVLEHLSWAAEWSRSNEDEDIPSAWDPQLVAWARQLRSCADRWQVPTLLDEFAGLLEQQRSGAISQASVP